MDITIIGSGTAVPSVRRSSPCILVRTRSNTIVCDLGPGSLRQLIKAGVSISDIDILIYSHLHIDHTADFTPFLFCANYNPDAPRMKDLLILGPPGFRTFYDGLCNVYGHWIMPHRFTMTIREIQNSPITEAGFLFKSVSVEHTESSIAIRIEDSEGKTIGYSGDTGYCQGIIDLATGTDLLILECSFPDDRPCSGHLTPTLAARIARESGCRRLILTHFYPACDAYDIQAIVQNVFPGEVIIAEDFYTISI
ncbi:MAG: MBL fold metallo-hydrolase [Desulfobacterota bacterium]|nr:MBL fold metallo-hydrolase [Thermodesulfobacteriota bacterium]